MLRPLGLLILLVIVCALCPARVLAFGMTWQPIPGAQDGESARADCLYDGRSMTLYDPSEGNPSEKLAEQDETLRMFGNGRDSDCKLVPIMKKALVATPLWGSHNSLQLMMRPPSDMYTTYVKRYFLRNMKNLPPITAPAGCVAVDLHLHTCYSHDSLTEPKQVLLTAAKRGLTGVAIADHDTLLGALKAQHLAAEMTASGELPPTFFVIAGEEISSDQGHIVGLFLTHTIPCGMSVADTIRAIHEQGGIAIAAHPKYPGSGVGELALTEPFDLVESRNGAEEILYTSSSRAMREKRREFYTRVTKPQTGSSDAHDPGGIAVCYTQLTCAPTLADVRRELQAGRTLAITRITDEQAYAMMHKGVLSGIVGIKNKYDMITNRIVQWLCDDAGATSANVTLLPLPTFSYTRKF